MDEGIKVIVISGVVSVLGALITLLVTKWLEIRQSRLTNSQEGQNALATLRFGRDEDMRKELQGKIDKKDDKLDRQERAFILLRDATFDLVRKDTLTYQLAIHELKGNQSAEAKLRLEEGIKFLSEFKIPELPPIDRE